MELLQSDGRGRRPAGGETVQEAIGAAGAGGTMAAMRPLEVVELRERVAALERENEAMREQLAAGEREGAREPSSAASAAASLDLLEFARSMQMRPPSAAGAAAPPSQPARPSSHPGDSATSQPAAGAPVPRSSGGARLPKHVGVSKRAPARGASSPPPPSVYAQWCSDVASASSERDPDGYGSHQLVGPPRIYPMHGRLPGAWQPSAATDGSAWIELTFAVPVVVSAIEVYETFRAGAIVSISLWRPATGGAGHQGDASGSWDAVWKGESEQRHLASEARQQIRNPFLQTFARTPTPT